MKRGDLALLLGDAAVSTVVLASLREQLTRTSACHAGSCGKPSNPPDSETGTKSRDNAELYRETYGEAEPIAELIPYMLESFLAADRGFVKARREHPHYKQS